MSPMAVSLTTLLCVLSGALAGLILQTVLPGHHLREDSKDVVRVVTGLMATLSALVLGLLIASGKSSFDAVDGELRQIAAKVIVLDRALAQYGPDAKDARELLRNGYAAGVDRLFSASGRHAAASGAMRDAAPLEQLDAKLLALAPANDAQRALKARAERIIEDMTQSRWLTFGEIAGGIPTGFVVVLVSWLAAMFVGFGLFAPRSATAIAALVIGALAVSTSIFLIEELSRPLDGVIALSGEAMRNAVAVLGK